MNQNSVVNNGIDNKAVALKSQLFNVQYLHLTSCVVCSASKQSIQ